MKQNILVVDDDIMLANSVSRLLKANGYMVTTATSGKDAFSFLELLSFDLVLSEITMGCKKGLTVLSASKYMHPKTKVILYSCDTVYETLSMAFKCGADGFLAKPFVISDLLYQIELCLGSQTMGTQERMAHHVPAAKNVREEGFFKGDPLMQTDDFQCATYYCLTDDSQQPMRRAIK